MNDLVIYYLTRFGEWFAAYPEAYVFIFACFFLVIFQVAYEVHTDKSFLSFVISCWMRLDSFFKSHPIIDKLKMPVFLILMYEWMYFRVGFEFTVTLLLIQCLIALRRKKED